MQRFLSIATVSYTHLDVYKRQVIAMPMLDNQDNENLRRLLDSVAADVVTFRCAVRIEVREAKDYPWVCLLYTSRCV